MSDIFEEYAELVRRYKAGDEAAFGEIYDRSARFVYATCLGVLGNPEDASDAMQETYLAVYKNIDSLADEKKLIGWIKRIAVTKSTDLLRKKKGETYYDDAIASEEVLEGDDDLESLPDYYIVEKTKRDTLHELIKNALSDVQYQTVLFHYFDEMSVEEIAKVMNCPVGTVKTRLKSSRILIKREVEKYEKENDDKLAAFAGVPFLTGFFNARAADTNVPDITPLIKEVLDAVTKSATNSANAAKTAATATQTATTVKSGAAGFFATAAGKATAFIAAGVLIVSTVIGVTQIIKDDKKDKREDEQEPTMTSEVTEETDSGSLFEQMEEEMTEASRAPAIEILKDDIPEFTKFIQVARSTLTDFDHNRPDEDLYHSLFPQKGHPWINFSDYDPDFKHDCHNEDPRGIFDNNHTCHITLESLLFVEKHVLNMSDENIEYFNNTFMVPFEQDGEMFGAYIDGDTVWFYYDFRGDSRTILHLKYLYDGEYYYFECLHYSDYKWLNDPEYDRFSEGTIYFYTMQYKEDINGESYWSMIRSSVDPSTFPGELFELPTPEQEERARNAAIENNSN